MARFPIKGRSPVAGRGTRGRMTPSSAAGLCPIQAWLGHAQVATTHRYATVDVELMRRRLDKAGIAGKGPARFQPKEAVLQLLDAI